MCPTANTSRANTCCLLLGLALAIFPAPARAHVYNLSADFSFSSNPNGPWQYGYSATNSLALDQFQVDTSADTADPVGFWHPAAGAAGYYPYVAQNTTNASRTPSFGGWAVRPGEVAMEASNSGQYSLIRFTTPQSGDYQVDASFEGIHFNLSTTDVHVLYNDASLFDALIDGYGGDPNFHTVEGASPTASYTGLLHLQANDLLTFAVGYGANQTHFNDTTGLFATIQSVPEPSTLAFLALALGAARARSRVRAARPAGPASSVASEAELRLEADP